MNRFGMMMLGATLGTAALVAPTAQAQHEGHDHGTPTPPTADTPGAEAMIAKINAVQRPRLTAKRGEDGYADALAAYRKDLDAYNTARAALIWDLYKNHPDHKETPDLMKERWRSLSRTKDGVEAVLEETNTIRNHGKGPIAIDAGFAYAQTIATRDNYQGDAFEDALAQFIKMAPTDDRPAGLLMSATRRMEDPAQKLETFRRVLKQYPDARATRYTAGKIKQITQINKPFELEFNDAISGETVSMKDLRGKVVVIDFWATWCGPCIVEMPHMKKLYAAYKDKGVEFVGISLDQPEDKGGLDKLLAYCDENDIGWPQYYQGAHWAGEFSMGWGVNSIPAIFVVDQKGNLHSVNARGKLDEMIPELLGIKRLTKPEDG